MTQNAEIELKFAVPASARAAIVDELMHGAAAAERTTLAAAYLDTPDRRLARAGIAWRLRREGRRWIQALKAAGASSLERFEHEVIRPGAIHDAQAHAGTPVGERLLAILAEAARDGLEVQVRFRTEVRRLARRMRTRGAVVEVAYDEGRLLAGDAQLRIREIEFELVSGRVDAMLALAQRWRQRHGLVYEPRSKAERGDRLADGSPHPPLRKSRRPGYDAAADAVTAAAAVLDECLDQILHNAAGLVDGDPALRVEHVHQMRVGIRRLRSALRSFEGWVPMPPDDLVARLKVLFAALGASRDLDVLDSGVARALAQVGAPPIAPAVTTTGPDPAGVVRSDATQRLLLDWLSWRAALPALAAASEPAAPVAQPAADDEAQADAPDTPAVEAPPAVEPLRRLAARRLRRWHRRIAQDEKRFGELDETALHALRKRIKRQRYAVEFFAPLMRRRRVERYLRRLAAIQERMGELNDLVVARTHYQALVSTDPAAWFALGWIAARLVEVKALAGPELARLAEETLPRR